MPHIRHRGVEKELIKLRYYSAKRWVVVKELIRGTTGSETY